MSENTLRGVVAHVHVTPAARSALVSAKILQSHLKELGASVGPLGKATHVIFHRKPTEEATDEERRADDEAVRTIVSKVEKLPAQLVRSSWIESSRQLGYRAMEGQHQVSLPKPEHLLSRIRNSSTPRPSTGKKRPARDKPPRLADEFEMTQLTSSSQQIINGEDEEFTSPPAKKRANNRRAIKKVSPQELPFDTQACADVMTADLPLLSMSRSPSPVPEPPARAKSTKDRAAKQTGAKRSASRGRTTKMAPANTAATEALTAIVEERMQESPNAAAAMADASAPTATKRPARGCTAAAASKAASKAAPAACRVGTRARASTGAFKPPRLATASSGSDPEDATLATSTLAATSTPAAAVEGTASASKVARDLDGGADVAAIDAAMPPAGKKAAALRQPSARQLAAAPDKDLAISVATPANWPAPASPAAPAAQDTAREAIPLPGVQRLPTPGETVTTCGTQDAGCSQAEPRADTTPANQPVAEVPAIWSAERPWDQQHGAAPGTHAAAPSERKAKPARKAGSKRAAADNATDVKENQDPAQPAPAQKMQKSQGGSSEVAAAPAAPKTVQTAEPPSKCSTLASAGASKRSTVAAAIHSRATKASAASAALAVTGVLSFSSLEPEVAELARHAVRALGGMQLCGSGKEDGRVTHLILGSDRRTIKVLLAIANGAHILTPAWVTASLEAGRWLPEQDYASTGRFAEAAGRVRAAKAAGKPLQLMSKSPMLSNAHVAAAAGFKPPALKGKQQGATKEVLRRLVVALGGRVVAAKDAKVCIVAGDGGRPCNIPSKIPALRDEWLLLAAETARLPTISSRFYVE